MYVCQPVFLAWIVFSVFGNTEIFGQHIYFMPIIGDGPHPFYFEVHYFTVAVLAALFLHKFLICQKLGDALAVTEEIVCSTLISLNNIVYQSFDLIIILFQRITWVPMKKDPYKTLTLFQTVRTLWPGTALGLFLSYIVFTYCPPVTFLVFPVLICFSISIPIVYLTSLPWLR
jgi:membrane glycosyltransferase